MRYYIFLIRYRLISKIIKSISARAGIKKQVSPYIIKSLAITSDFNRQINPRIIQRKARHKNVETTFRYDHTDDTTVRDFLDRRHVESMEGRGEDDDLKQTAEILQRLIDGEIDVKELAREIKSAKRKGHKDDVAYL